MLRLQDLKWQRIKESIDITKILGRCYYFNKALIWWLIDVIVFFAIGIKWTLLIVSIPLGIITFFATVNWIRTLVYAALCKATPSKFEDKILDRANALQGVPGSGKTSTINQLGYILAKRQWRRLQHEYWKICHTDFEKLSDKLKDKYKEVVKAYEFYNKHLDKFIPCLHSLTPIKVNGRQSYTLSKGQLLQKEPLPYRCVQVADEISNLFPNTRNSDEKANNANVAEMSRWIRHFLDSYALYADIRFGDAFLAIRSVCGCVITLEEKQKWLLKPRFLIALKTLIMSFVDWSYLLLDICKFGTKSYYKAKHDLVRSSVRKSRFICWLDKLINCVGYRKYTFRKDGCGEQTNCDDVHTLRGHYYFKSCLDVQYNDRAFKNLYKQKDRPLNPPITLPEELTEEQLKQILDRK